MNVMLKIVLSLSVSGGLLILALLAGQRLWRDRLSRQWQYYIWLVVLLRLLLPFGPQASLMGRACQAVDRAVAQAEALPQAAPAVAAADGAAPALESVAAPAAGAAAGLLRAAARWLAAYGGWLWLAVALGLLVHKSTAYQSFLRYLRAGLTPVDDLELLNELALTAKRAGVRRPVELGVNPLVSSPLLIGFFRPCIVLPSADIPAQELRYIFLHELIHYRRQDLLYKWLVQLAVCLHWFNPLVHRMSREIARACEFSCDEAVLASSGPGSAQEYGQTLLDAMAAVGRYRETLGAVTLSENKQLLKERLKAMMNYRKKRRAARLAASALTACLVLGAAYVGVYPAAAAWGRPGARSAGTVVTVAYAEPERLPLFANTVDRIRQMAERMGGSLGSLFGGRGGRKAQQTTVYQEQEGQILAGTFYDMQEEQILADTLGEAYENQDVAAFSQVLNMLEADSPLPAAFAEKAYEDSEIAFFSILTGWMDEEERMIWLDQASSDGKVDFQAVLLSKLGLEEEQDRLERTLAEQQLEEYRIVGVTRSGKRYYYEGEPVYVFLDERPDSACYTLEMSPSGTVSVRILRDAQGQITGAVQMSDAEVAGLIGGLNDPDGLDEGVTHLYYGSPG